ncbi:MAG: biotin/lipoyl-binding protein, partial [Acidobacteriaceae bacterium]
MTTSMAVTETQEVVESATLTEKWYTRLTKAQWMVGAGVLIAIVIYAFLHAGRVSTSDAQIEAHIVTIAPHVPGYVEELRIDDNWKVDPGQPLFTIDPRDYQVRLEQAKNAYDTALAQAHAAQVGVDVARNIAVASSRSATASLRAQGAGFEKDREAWKMAAGPELEAAQAVAQAKEAAAERAERDLDRYRPLVKTGEISQLQFDAFSASAKVAQSEAAQARAQIDTARRIVTIAHSQMDISDAGID